MTRSLKSCNGILKSVNSFREGIDEHLLELLPIAITEDPFIRFLRSRMQRRDCDGVQGDDFEDCAGLRKMVVYSRSPINRSSIQKFIDDGLILEEHVLPCEADDGQRWPGKEWMYDDSYLQDWPEPKEL